jgi:urea transport system permease protein
LVLPDGIVGWLRYRALDQIRSLFGRSPYSPTYPSLEDDPDVQYERQNIGD